MTAFFVTLSWRPISLAQTPSFHNAMSAAARSGVHSCVIDPTSFQPGKKVTSLFHAPEHRRQSRQYVMFLSSHSTRGKNTRSETPWK